MSISEDFLDSVRERCNILDIVSEHVSIKKAGHNYVGLCPFHSEKTPSFFVYTQTNSFYCFGCGIGGDPIRFLALIEGIQYKDASIILAEKLGIQTPDGDFCDYFEKRKNIYEINRIAAKFYHFCLVKNCDNPGFRYLRSRMILPSTIKHFGLGYACSSGVSLVNFLRKNKFSDDIIIQSNLGIKKNNGILRDRFVNRVIFPIVDIRGNVIAFGARSINNALPKYLNTSDTLVFKKSENLFSLNFAKKEKYFILSEGYMDVISLNQLGFKSAIASLGTSLTQRQARIMSRYTDTVYLCYDSDSAGQKATNRAIDILKKEKLMIKIIDIEGAKDPDEFIKKNKDNSGFKFKKMMKEAKNSVEFEISKCESRFDVSKIDEKIIFLKEIEKILSKIDDPVERDVYSSKICSKYKISKGAFDIKIGKNYNLSPKNSNFREIKIQKINNCVNRKYIEEFLISCIMRNNDFAKSVDDLRSEDFCENLNFRILEKIRFLLSRGKSITVGSVSEGFDLADSSKVVKIANLFSSDNVSFKTFLDCVESFKMSRDLRKFKSCVNFDSEKILSFLGKLKKNKT